MIDFELEMKSIQPINMKDMELQQYRVNDKVRKSIVLYNKAISEIKTKDLDLAIKDLKRALSYNSGFSEGIKLLGLCYVNSKKYRKAEKVFKKLMQYEIYSDLAKEYRKNLIIEKSMSKTIEAIRRESGNSNDKRRKSTSIKALGRRIIIGLWILVIGIGAFALVSKAKPSFSAIFKKGNIEKRQVASQEKVNKDSKEDVILKEDIKLKEDIVSKEEYENIQKELDNTRDKLDFYKNNYDILLILNGVEKSYMEGDYEKAAMDLINIKNMEFNDEARVKFEKLWSDIKTKALWDIYNKGSKLYKDGKYEEALPKLIIVYEIDPSLDIMPWVTYQIGKAYKEINDNTNSLVFLQRVKDNYPKSKYASYSERIINEIKN